MSNSYFQFKQFTIHQDRCAMKVTTDACLFGAWVAEEVRSQKLKVKSLLDIGTGTGLLSLMSAQKSPDAKIDALEIDKQAAEQAKTNVELSPWKDRIEVIHSDAKIFSFSKKYDIIISNPPFYEKEIKSASDIKNVAHHSEELTLVELLAVIKKNLAPEGQFFLLLPYKRNEEIKKLLNDHQFHISQIIFVKQTVSHDYFRIILVGKIKSNPGVETAISEISICNENQEYSSDLVQLLQEYYLFL